MNHLALSIAAMALAFAATALADRREPPVERLEAEAHGTLTIEADGRVSAVELPEALKPPLRGLYEDAIKGWTFHPIEVDGRIVRAVGHMSLGLYIEFRGEDLVAAGIERVQFVDPPADSESSKPPGQSIRHPRYPQSLAARGIGGRVMLQVETDAEGRVQRVATREGALFARIEGAKPGDVERAFAKLAEASESAARRWVLPNCGGRCVLPVVFTFGRTRTPAFWQPVIDVAHVPPPWVLEGDAPIALASDGGAPSARFRPLAPIEGIELVRTGG